MRKIIIAVSLSALTLLSGTLTARDLDTAERLESFKQDLPEVLKPWVGWVKEDYPEINCPHLDNGQDRLCAWPADSSFEFKSEKGRFEIRWQTYLEGWQPIPGDSRIWPDQVSVNGQPAAVIVRNNQPGVILPPGRHRISGELIWQAQRPQHLSIPDFIGRIELTVDDRTLDYPQRQAGQLLLTPSGEDHNSIRIQENDTLNVDIYRKLTDSRPMTLDNYYRIEVTGQPRRITIPLKLPDDFKPYQMRSPLPATINADDELTLLARAGQWDLQISALLSSVSTTAIEPSSDLETPEIWFFQHQPNYRQVQINQNPIDVSQLNVPEHLTPYNAYQTQYNETMQQWMPLELKVSESPQQRPADSNLKLTNVQTHYWLDEEREQWLFSGQAINPNQEHWRVHFDHRAKAGSLSLNQKLQPITLKLQDNDQFSDSVLLNEQGRIDYDGYLDSENNLPASPFNVAGEQLRLSLYIPKDQLVLSINGADEGEQSWLGQWRFHDLFVLIMLGAMLYFIQPGKLIITIPLFITLVTAYPLLNSPFLWLLFLMMTLALLIKNISSSEQSGTSRRVNKLSRWAFSALLVMMTPLMIWFGYQQFMLTFYPHIDTDISNQIRTSVYMEKAQVPKSGPIPDASGAPLNDYRNPAASRMKATAQSLEQLTDSQTQKNQQRRNTIDNDWKVPTGYGMPTLNSERVNRISLRLEGNGQQREVTPILIPASLSGLIRLLLTVGLLGLLLLITHTALPLVSKKLQDKEGSL